jgi:hypothetical protein
MKQLNDRMDEFLSEDARLPLIVKAIRKEPDFLGFQISEGTHNRLVSENAQLMEFFRRNKRMFFSIVVFQEFIKEVACTLAAKEYMVDMIAAYEAVKIEDTKFECAVNMFQRQIPN